MAKKKTNKPVKNTKKKKKGFSFWGVFSALIMTMGAVLMMPTTIIFVIAMIPTAVASFTDRTMERTAGITVGAMNFAGVLPALLNLWQSGHAVENSLRIISQPLMLLYMYGGAGIGTLIYFNTPPIVSNFLKKKGLNRLDRIEKRHKQLIEKWGITVTGIDPETQKEKSSIS